MGDGGSPYDSTKVNKFLARWGAEWCPPPALLFPVWLAEPVVKLVQALLCKRWRGRGQSLGTNEWVKGILQRKNTRHKSTRLFHAITLYGRSVQDAIPHHKSLLFCSWRNGNLQIYREAAKRKEASEKYYNRGSKPFTQLKVGDPVCEHNINAGRWDRYGRVMKCF